MLVVCSGNTCRSPIASALLARSWQEEAAADPALMVPAVHSAGLHAADGGPASPGAILSLAALDLDLTDHVSRPVSAAMLGEADQVLVMTYRQREELAELAPDLAAKVELFDPEGGEIEDPFGSGRSVYAACAARLADAARQRVRRALPRATPEKSA